MQNSIHSASIVLHSDLQNILMSGNYPDSYKKIINDIEIQQEKLTSTEWRYAIETVLALAILEKNAKELATISDEDQRNQCITDLTHLIAEPGLAPGRNPQEILLNIHQLTSKLFEAYDFDQKQEDTISLYKLGFMGPPCFNGRVITLEEYILAKQKFIDPQTISDKTSYDSVAYQYSELMYECRDDEALPSIEEFVEFLKNREDFYSEHQEVVNSSQFKEIYKRACELYV